MPSSPSKTEQSVSLYAIGIQLQQLSSEISTASELLMSDDPDLVAEGAAILEHYLSVEESTKSALATKADRLLIFCDHLIAQAAFRKDQAKRLNELAKRDEAAVAKLHDYLIKVITTLNPKDNKFSFPTHELTSRKSEVVEIDSELDPEHDLPADLVRTKTTYEPDKAAIKAAIKAGQAVPGCSLLERRNWTVK